MNDFQVLFSALLITFILALLHHLSNKISNLMEKHHYRILSLSAGTLIAMIFLVLLPEVLNISNSPFIFLFILLGFAIFHLTEKFLYQHVKNKREILKELKELHILGFFIDHFILGFVLVTALEITHVYGYLLLIPIFLNTISSSFTMAHIHEKTKTNFNKLLLSIAPMLGALVAFALDIDPQLEASILAFILGMLLYIVNRDILPTQEKGDPILFVLGSFIVVIIWIGLLSAGL
jgi:zinc transporter ZupT